jgi:transcription antitermination factor NusG
VHDPHHWYALHVRSRAERAVELKLQEKGYETFVPLCRALRVWSDRKKTIEQPLIPNYVFCRNGEHTIGRVVSTPGVIRILSAARVPLPVDDEEIAALRRIVSSAAAAEPWPYLTVGQRVRVSRGPLLDLEGILTSIGRGDRLVVSVTMLQRSVAVEIDSASVMPVGELCPV